jgi:23S rRNA pseudouridine1911/1915/1917 synthase
LANPDESASLVFTVPVQAAGLRLDVFLTGRDGIGGRRHAKELILAGAVAVDGRPAHKGGLLVEAGQRVVVRELPAPEVPPPVAAPAPPADLTVLYEDAWILVIDKPAGVPAHRPEGARGAGMTNIADLARARCPDLPTVAGADRPGIVHRLDRDTTGVMVLAKTEDAMHFLKAQFKARTVEKEYRAIVWGEPRFDSDWIDRSIAPHPAHGDRVVLVQEGGRDASTYYEVVERFGGITHLRCLPKTGRTHQIRVHLTGVGLSLVGDPIYRSRRNQQARLPAGAPDPGRHCLHALRLVLDHPRTQERLTFEAAMPADMEALLDWLRANRTG